MENGPGERFEIGDGPSLILVGVDGSELARDLRQLVDEGAGYYGVDARFEVRHGDPYTEFLRVAEETRADTVVVGVSTHAGHRIMGSLAVKLVRAGRWPVTVVP